MSEGNIYGLVFDKWVFNVFVELKKVYYPASSVSDDSINDDPIVGFIVPNDVPDRAVFPYPPYLIVCVADVGFEYGGVEKLQ